MPRKILLVICLLLLFKYQGFSQVVKWATKSGWVLKKEGNNSDFKRFFAIGLYGIPGYTLNKLSAKGEQIKYPSNFKTYNNIKPYVNILFSQSGYSKGYMENVTKVVGTSEFPWTLKKEYLPRSISHKKDDVAYNTMYKIRQEATSPHFKGIVNNSIKSVLKYNNPSQSNFIWAPFDEVASGFGGWCWPTSAVNVIYQEIKKENSNTLIFANILGGGDGNSYLFEQYYIKKYGALPESPPYNTIFKNEKAGKTLLSFHSSYKGDRVFQYKNGRLNLNSVEPDIYLANWYENVKETAYGYKGSADIFGFNSYKSFFKNPVLAGISVDAIKDGAGRDCPIWMFFDSNGHAKPSNVTAQSYVNNVKCQIYTSLIHGATGVLFWGNGKKEAVVFNELLPVLEELQKIQNIFYYATAEVETKGDIQYVVKDDGVNKYIIAVNTSTNKTVKFNHSLSKKKVFNPLEVYISKV